MARNQKLAGVAIALIIVSIIMILLLDILVNYTLYSFSLQFNQDWFYQQQVYTYVGVGLLICAAGTIAAAGSVSERKPSHEPEKEHPKTEKVIIEAMPMPKEPSSIGEAIAATKEELQRQLQNIDERERLTVELLSLQEKKEQIKRALEKLSS